MSCNICGCGTFVDMASRADSLFVRKGVMCARCGSLERHRLLYAFLVDEGLLSGNRRVLHIAPEHCIAPILRARFGTSYVAADLDVGRYSHADAVTLDLCRDLGRFAAGSFDLVIHNHVIEHVACDYRGVLSGLDALVCDGGWHVFSIPFLPGGYREATGNESDEWRVETLGQVDHERVFSPEDVGETIGKVIEFPEVYDATQRFAPERLRAMNIPRDQWHGFNNNAVFFLRRRGNVETLGASRTVTVTDQVELADSREAPRGGVLMLSANGIGQGHLTRQLAVAQALTVKAPTFLTMSYAARVVRDAGFPVQFIPHHGATNEDPVVWNIGLEREINLLLDHLRADTLVYDVNFVFDGVIAVLRQRKDLRGIWIRRAFWPSHHVSYLGAAIHFQAVVEPGDLAEALDDGPTVAERSKVLRVPPVLQIEPDMRLSRKEARAALRLPEDSTVVAVDLGGSLEAGFAEASSAVVDALLGRPDVQVLEFASPLAVTNDNGRLAPNHLRRRLRPAFLYSRAFDAIVTRAGYNTFHECLLGAIPALFIPSEAADMDRQMLRARFAQDGGMGLMLRLGEIRIGLRGAIDVLLDPAHRTAMAEACSGLTWEGRPWQNGAKAIARLIDTGRMDE